jgi:Transcriptional regulatory protein, C terminal
VSTRLVFGILGPLEVRLSAAPVRVGGPRQRALLALLLCHANRIVSRDQLIDELLSDQPAGSAERMLRVQVSRLRKAVADGDGQPRQRHHARCRRLDSSNRSPQCRRPALFRPVNRTSEVDCLVLETGGLRRL